MSKLTVGMPTYKIIAEFIDPPKRWHELIRVKVFLLAFMLMLMFVMGIVVAKAETIDLNIIAKIESSNNPLAYNPKSHARGLYQITPICLKDYNQQNRQNLGVNALFRQSTCRTVAQWYFVARIPQLLRNRGIVVTLDNVIWAYNAGIGKVVKGIMPKETRQYIVKYHRLAGVK